MSQEQTDTYENEIAYALHEYRQGVGDYKEKMPKIGQAYMDFTAACFQEGELDQKTKQLIALGVSLFSQDEYCLIYHTHEALQHGATEKEILEVVGVCSAFGGGFVMSQGVTLVQECLQTFGDDQAH